MTRPHPAVVKVNDEAIVITGGPHIFDTLRPAGFRCIYGGTIGGWYLARHRRGVDRLPDVLAVMQGAGYGVRVVEGEPWGEQEQGTVVPNGSRVSQFPNEEPKPDRNRTAYGGRQPEPEPVAPDGLLW